MPSVGGYKFDSKELYVCTQEDLEEAIDDLNNPGIKYILSIRMIGGQRVFSFPVTIDKAKEKVQRLVSAMENDKIVEISNTWINCKNILTVRIAKYIPEDARYSAEEE